jgi:hypothetical protein
MDWNAVAVGIVIAVFVSASLNILERHVNAPRSKQIALVPIVKCRTKCARDMESANAISVNVRAHILANSVRALQGTKHLIRSVSFMRHVYNVLLAVNSSMNVPITKKSARRLKMVRSINLSFMTISQVSRFWGFMTFMMNSFTIKGWTI